MARVKKDIIGHKTMRVNKQKVTTVKNKISKTPEIFIGKPTPMYQMPPELNVILQKYILNPRSVSIYNTRNSNKKKDPEKKSVVNGFTAFRIYYSKFGRTYKDQENLSKELANFWNKNNTVQDIWHGYSEEYKACDTKLSFVKWFETFKSTIQVEKAPNQHLKHKSKISHLIVEDIYESTSE